MAFTKRIAALAAVVAIPLGIAATSQVLAGGQEKPDVPQRVRLDGGTVSPRPATPGTGTPGAGTPGTGTPGTRTPGTGTPSPSPSASPSPTGDEVVPGPPATGGGDDDDGGDDGGDD